MGELARAVAHLVADPMAHPFMVRALLASVTVGGLCGVMGTLVVLRGMAFLGDALAHAILPGVAAAYLAGARDRASMFWWAMAAAVLSALGVALISTGAQLREDVAIGIVFSGMFALGIALISSIRSYAVDLAHILFGNVLQVSWAHLFAMWATSALVLSVLAALWKELILLAFDPVFASTIRIPARTLHATLVVLVAIVIVVALHTVGVALAVAMLVTPAATASLVSKRLRRRVALSAALGSASGATGLYAAYYLSLAPGAVMVLVATALFVITFLATKAARRWRPPGVCQLGR